MAENPTTEVCHCGRPVTGNGDEWQDRVMIDMCNPCRSARCDTWDGRCPPVVYDPTRMIHDQFNNHGGEARNAT